MEFFENGSREKWKYFARELGKSAKPIIVLYLIGVPRKEGPEKVRKFIEEKRAEWLNDRTINELVNNRFNLQSGGQDFAFSVEKVTTFRRPSHKEFAVLLL
ncbi:MAG: hypothetical protein M1393_00755 [Candidatus Thermoplasmatota archaeon]|nr:hypothetical protein [Candidatus Thermoplasmatota archaeon]MCL6089558.1 hypothetical protein [Candidatus Thermoplasmatota archaeon]MDA8144188.1 hypothetical protein [Thermoplasmatales archaeon]